MSSTEAKDLGVRGRSMMTKQELKGRRPQDRPVKRPITPTAPARTSAGPMVGTSTDSPSSRRYT